MLNSVKFAQTALSRTNMRTNTVVFLVFHGMTSQKADQRRVGGGMMLWSGCRGHCRPDKHEPLQEHRRVDKHTRLDELRKGVY